MPKPGYDRAAACKPHGVAGREEICRDMRNNYGEKPIVYRCSRCKWHEGSFCGCISNQHFKESVNPYVRDCPDWTGPKVREGTLSDGSSWKEYVKRRA